MHLRSQSSQSFSLRKLSSDQQPRGSFFAGFDIGVFLTGLLSIILAALVLIASFTRFSYAATRSAQEPSLSTTPEELKGVGIFEQLGKTVSIDELSFRDEQGRDVRLAQYFRGKKPILLTLVYYECPNLCNFLLNGLTQSLKNLEWTPGKEFDIVTVSVDPREGPALATQKKEAYLKTYGRPQAAAGWHFLTGSEIPIKRLASQVGFGYRYDEKEKQFAHSAALFILTPEGKISRYLYGIDYPQKDLRLALLEASQGQIGSIVDRFLLFCYRYDPQSRKYSVYLNRVMQTGAAGTMVLFGGYLTVFWRRQRQRRWG